MKELAFILGVIRFINNRLAAIAARTNARRNKESIAFEQAKQAFEKRAEELAKAQEQAEAVERNLRALIND